MARFQFSDTRIQGLCVVDRVAVEDKRGFLSRIFCTEEFRCRWLDRPIAQINHTCTRARGVVRGMHFQSAPYAETKLVTCVAGAVYDVAVDLRRESPTFLRWHGEVLSADNRRSLLIPEGLAHGFQALSDDAELVYLHSMAYHPEAEGAVNALDPRIGIEWPMEVTDMSDRDRSHSMLDDRFSGIAL